MVWQVNVNGASTAEPRSSAAWSTPATGGKIAASQPSANHLHSLRPKKDKNFTSPNSSSFPSPSSSFTTTITTITIAVVIQLLEPTRNHEPLHSPLGTGF